MVKISFKGKINKHGLVQIPVKYLEDGILWSGQQFLITVDTSEDEWRSKK